MSAEVIVCRIVDVVVDGAFTSVVVLGQSAKRSQYYRSLSANACSITHFRGNRIDRSELSFCGRGRRLECGLGLEAVSLARTRSRYFTTAGCSGMWVKLAKGRNLVPR